MNRFHQVFRWARVSTNHLSCWRSSLRPRLRERARGCRERARGRRERARGRAHCGSGRGRLTDSSWRRRASGRG
jgi:hypothetical protein